MRFTLGTFLSAVFVLIASVGLIGQVRQATPIHLIARLSYSNTLMEKANDSARQVCVAVYDNGLYQLWRPDLIELKQGSPDSLRTVFEGTLTKEQMQQLGSMLRGLNFKSKGGGLVEEGSESFLAELVNSKDTVRLKWVDPDHRQPFPQSVNRIIDWLQDLGTQGTTQFSLRELGNISVCPSANDNPLPLTAAAF